jgi:hypothetical protein
MLGFAGTILLLTEASNLVFARRCKIKLASRCCPKSILLITSGLIL